jgi:hypothetical protein
MQSGFDPWTRAGGSKDRRQNDYNNGMVKDFGIVIIIGQEYKVLQVKRGRSVNGQLWSVVNAEW